MQRKRNTCTGKPGTSYAPPARSGDLIDEAFAAALSKRQKTAHVSRRKKRSVAQLISYERRRAPRRNLTNGRAKV